MDKKFAKEKDAEKNKKTSHLSLNIPINLKNAFKSKLAKNGQNMTDVVIELIKDYLDKTEKSGNKK